jgi:hypothetical protein
MLKGAIIKNYITYCANGETEKLKKLVLSNDSLLNLTRGFYGNNKSGLYYSIRNKKLETTKYLIEQGLRIELKDIRSLIGSTWYGAPDSLRFHLILDID